MKKFFVAVALILLTSTTDARLPFEVKAVYFKPANVNADNNVAELMKNVQSLYRNEMNRYGYGQKTFRLDPVVSIVHGKQNAAFYTNKTWAKINQELPAQFKDQNSIYLIVIGGVSRIDGNCGFGWPIYGWASGGTAIMAEHTLCPDRTALAAHELGHAFGLYHDLQNPHAIMGAGDDEFNNFECRWLDKHHYFNNVHAITNVPEITRINRPTAVRIDGKENVRFTIDVRSNIELHQAHLVRSSDVGVVGWTKVDGRAETIQIPVVRSLVTTDSRLFVQILDIKGNHLIQDFSFSIPDPIVENRIVREPEDNQKDTKKGLNEDLKPVSDGVNIVTRPILDKKDTDLEVSASSRLITSWARLKR